MSCRKRLTWHMKIQTNLVKFTISSIYFPRPSGKKKNLAHEIITFLLLNIHVIFLFTKFKINLPRISLKLKSKSLPNIFCECVCARYCHFSCMTKLEPKSYKHNKNSFYFILLLHFSPTTHPPRHQNQFAPYLPKTSINDSHLSTKLNFSNPKKAVKIARLFFALLCALK